MGRWSSDYVPLTDAERNQDKKLNDVNKVQEAVEKLAAEADALPELMHCLPQKSRL